MDKMREEFEAWAASYRDHNGLPHFTLRRPDGKYVDGTTELCWRGWQASRDSLALKFPDPSARPYQYDPYDGDAVYEQLKAIVEGAGIKVTV